MQGASLYALCVFLVENEDLKTRHSRCCEKASVWLPSGQALSVGPPGVHLSRCFFLVIAPSERTVQWPPRALAWLTAWGWCTDCCGAQPSVKTC